jgi:predicted P-loop ATPase
MKTIDIARVEAERDQLWAEAVHLYRSGYKWHLTEEEMTEAGKVTEERYEDDPWEVMIDRFLVGKNKFRTHDVIKELDIPVAQQTQLTSRRIGRHLRHRGWEKYRGREDGDRDYFWYPPGSRWTNQGDKQ